MPHRNTLPPSRPAPARPRRGSVLCSALGVLVLVLGGGRQSAVAEDLVPAIPDRDLAVVGTCAPIDTRNISIVTVGRRDDMRWFRVNGVAKPVDFAGLTRVLAGRAGTARPSPHGVWITAGATHAWVHVKRVREAAAAAGIYRTGLRVRSQATGQVMGFPLFLPPGRSGMPGPKAGLLKLRVNTVSAKEHKASSDPGHAYAAIRRALEKRATFGVAKVVASVWIATNARLQYVLTVLDLLYRGGCAGVRVRSGMQVPRLDVEPVTVLEIQGGVASRLPQALKPAPVGPRARPWGLLGAAEPGWVDFATQELPSLDGGRGPKKAGPALRPNYAARPAGVPSDVWRGVDNELRQEMSALGGAFARALRGGHDLDKRFTIGLRRKEALPSVLDPARRAFPDATRVVPATLQVESLLFLRGTLVGRAEFTLLLVGERLRVIFATWSPAQGAAAGTLVPFAVDPFAVGKAAALRVWTEALYGAVKKYGLRALPMATAAAVLPYFPAAAHQSVSAAIAGRGAALEALAAGIRGARFDRVVVSVRRGTATVYAGQVVVGILNFSLRAEEGALRLDDLKPRRAR